MRGPNTLCLENKFTSQDLHERTYEQNQKIVDLLEAMQEREDDVKVSNFKLLDSLLQYTKDELHSLSIK